MVLPEFSGKVFFRKISPAAPQRLFLQLFCPACTEVEMICRVLPCVFLIIDKSIAVVKIHPLSIRDLLQSISNLCNGLFFYEDLLRGEREGIEDDIRICHIVKICSRRRSVDVEKRSGFRNGGFAFPNVIQHCMVCDGGGECQEKSVFFLLKSLNRLKDSKHGLLNTREHDADDLWVCSRALFLFRISYSVLHIRFCIGYSVLNSRSHIDYSQLNIRFYME